MKIRVAILSLVAVTSLLVGCGTKNDATPKPSPVPSVIATPAASPKPDAVTGASVAKDEASLLKAAGKNGSWIIILPKDLTVAKEVIVEGDYTIPDKADATKKVATPRKLALYNQDDKRVKTASYTLTAPKLVIKSKDTIIKGGTFVGDVYVESNGFTLDDAKIQGNLYFTTDAAKSSFKSENNSSVTGKTEVKK